MPVKRWARRRAGRPWSVTGRYRLDARGYTAYYVVSYVEDEVRPDTKKYDPN